MLFIGVMYSSPPTASDIFSNCLYEGFVFKDAIREIALCVVPILSATSCCVSPKESFRKSKSVRKADSASYVLEYKSRP